MSQSGSISVGWEDDSRWRGEIDEIIYGEVTFPAQILKAFLSL